MGLPPEQSYSRRTRRLPRTPRLPATATRSPRRAPEAGEPRDLRRTPARVGDRGPPTWLTSWYPLRGRVATPLASSMGSGYDGARARHAASPRYAVAQPLYVRVALVEARVDLADCANTRAPWAPAAHARARLALRLLRLGTENVVPPAPGTGAVLDVARARKRIHVGIEGDRADHRWRAVERELRLVLDERRSAARSAWARRVVCHLWPAAAGSLAQVRSRHALSRNASQRSNDIAIAARLCRMASRRMP